MERSRIGATVKERAMGRYHPNVYGRLRHPDEIAKEAKEAEARAQREKEAKHVGDAIGAHAFADKRRRPNE